MNASSSLLKIVIADDESLARKRLLKFLEEFPESFEIKQASTGKEALILIENFKPDLIFLDIKMTDMTGFDVLQKIDREILPIIIFVTAFDSYAVKAFEVQAIDFLLKPYKKQRFVNALERGIKQARVKNREHFRNKMAQFLESMREEDSELIYPKKENYLQSLVLKKNKRYYFLKVSEIIFIKASGYYAEFFTVSKEKHIHRISMSNLIDQLDPNNFIRVNRSSILAVKHIEEIISEGMGDYSIRMSEGTTFSLSKSYKEAFLKKMGIR